MSSVKVDVRGPFFNDPGCPQSPPGEPCDELWEYEGNNSHRGYWNDYNGINMVLLIPSHTWYKFTTLTTIYVFAWFIVILLIWKENKYLFFILVAEIFFLGKNDRYLEVEFCP